MRFTEKYLDSEEFVLYSTSGANIIEIPDIVEGHKYGGQAINKFGQLEDIEQELGIDLITLFKALKNGIYYLNKQKELHWCQSRNLVISQKSLRVYRHHYKLFKDYGKTWALTKEEL